MKKGTFWDRLAGKNAAGSSLKGAMTLAAGGMAVALVFVGTYFLKLPVPMYSGYVHLGDGFILLSAALLGYAAVPAAAVGSLLADLFLGYATYALPTFVIKAVVAALAAAAAQRSNLGLRVLWLVLAEAAMVAGYFAAEWVFLGYGFAGAWASVPGNALQGVSGIILYLVLSPAFRRIKLPRQH